MNKNYMICLIFILLFALGCSNISTVERAELTDSDSRDKYIKEHPGGLHNDHIVNGEITVGMSVYEVLASWGFPNVYMISDSEEKEYWIYYVAESSLHGVTIYTLAFSDQVLEGWDLDLKRFSGERVVYREGVPTKLTVIEQVGIEKR